MKYKILLTDTCLSLLKKISDKKLQRTILMRIEGLSEDPDKQGKMLTNELSGFRSIRAAGRYRVIYKTDKHMVIVYILAAGIRKQGDKKDIYKITKKLLKAGLLDLELLDEE